MHPYRPSLAPGVCTCGHTLEDPTHGYGTANPQGVSPLRSMQSGAYTTGHVRAVARRTDPDTSWDAALSVTRIRESQREVLDVLERMGGLGTDEGIARVYNGRQSPSGLRTRRAELVTLGAIVDTGQRVVGSTGRRMIVWRAVQDT